MHMDQYIGRLLDDRYEILEVIGTGGMAVVYKARCHRLNRLVAIKILKDEYSGDEEFRRRFHAEGEAVAMLSHPNIVQVYDVSSSQYANYIVMELIDGISLRQYMEKKGVLNWKETLHFAMQIAKGLDHAHSRGIVHRDIKPHNVMVLKNGSVKVMDFGIARIMSKTNTLTKEALGSVHYISPEQAKGGRVDNRSDLYSLGVVMYEMMAGRPPYDGESPVAVAIQHINGGAALPSTLNPNIPSGMEQIIMKGMALEVKDRYVSAAEMLRDMEEFRKNPNIIFPYLMAGFSDATQPIDLNGLRHQGGARTTAEKVARNKGEVPRQRSGGSSARRTAGAAAGSAARSRAPGEMPVRRRKSRQEREAEEKRSRMTAIAIVACSTVAVVAIAIFLIALLNGAFFDRDAELVKVPDLVGDFYYSGMNVDGFYVDAEYEHNDEYEMGRIFDQDPPSGNKITKGATITVVVSLGEKPIPNIMQDLVGQTGEAAKAFLAGQGVNPLVLDGGFSDDVPKGVVLRTDPMEGDELTAGQIVYVYVSQGPLIPTAKMPNVVGLNYATAYKQLTDQGFSIVEPRYVESDETKDEVVGQSIAKDTDVDLTSKIILYVSKGPKETEKPTDETIKPTDESTKPTDETTKPTDETADPTDETTGSTAEPSEKTKVVRITLPQREEAFLLSIMQNGKMVRESIQIVPGTAYFELELTGTGVQSYEVLINGEHYQTIEVDFSK